MYTVSEGECSTVDYGLRLAKLVSLPDSIINHAKTVSERLDSFNRDLKACNVDLEQIKRVAKIKIVERLIQIKRSSTLSDADVVEYLKHLQRDYRKSEQGKVDEIMGDSDN